MPAAAEERVILLRVVGGEDVKRSYEQVSAMGDRTFRGLARSTQDASDETRKLGVSALDAARQHESAGSRVAAAWRSSLSTVGHAVQRTLNAVKDLALSTARALVMVSTASAALFAMSSINAAATRETQLKGLESLMGSAAKAKAHFAELQEVSKLPGVTLVGGLDLSIKLQSVGMEAALATRAIAAFGNALALAGKGEEYLSNVGLALSQIVGKGKVSAEEINQLSEAVPQIRGVMQAAFGTADTEAIAKMGLSAEQFIRVIVTGFESLPKAADTFANKLVNIKAAFTELMVAFGQGFVNAEGNSALDKLSTAIAGMVPLFQALGAAAAQSMPALVQWLASITTPESINAAISIVRLYVAEIAAIPERIGAAVQLVSDVWQTAVDTGADALDATASTVSAFATMLGAIGTAIAAWWDQCFGPGQAQKAHRSFRAVGDAAMGLGHAIGQAFGWMAQFVFGTIAKVSKAAGAAFLWMAKQIAQSMGWAGKQITDALSAVGDSFERAFDGIAEAFDMTKLFAGMQSAWDTFKRTSSDSWRQVGENARMGLAEATTAYQQHKQAIRDATDAYAAAGFRLGRYVDAQVAAAVATAQLTRDMRGQAAAISSVGAAISSVGAAVTATAAAAEAARYDRANRARSALAVGGLEAGARRAAAGQMSRSDAADEAERRRQAPGFVAERQRLWDQAGVTVTSQARARGEDLNPNSPEFAKRRTDEFGRLMGSAKLKTDDLERAIALMELDIKAMEDAVAHTAGLSELDKKLSKERIEALKRELDAKKEDLERRKRIRAELVEWQAQYTDAEQKHADNMVQAQQKAVDASRQADEAYAKQRERQAELFGKPLGEQANEAMQRQAEARALLSSRDTLLASPASADRDRRLAAVEQNLAIALGKLAELGISSLAPEGLPSYLRNSVGSDRKVNIQINGTEAARAQQLSANDRITQAALGSMGAGDSAILAQAKLNQEADLIRSTVYAGATSITRIITQAMTEGFAEAKEETKTMVGHFLAAAAHGAT